MVYVLAGFDWLGGILCVLAYWWCNIVLVVWVGWTGSFCGFRMLVFWVVWFSGFFVLLA